MIPDACEGLAAPIANLAFKGNPAAAHKPQASVLAMRSRA
jgi:hypothetical protein